MTCTIDTTNIEPQDRPESILYSGPSIIIYREINRLVMASCDGEILNSLPSPVDCMKYEFLDFDDAVLFVFNGLEFIILDKLGMLPERHKINTAKMGACATKLFPGDDTNRIIFGTKHSDRYQFVNYDFMSQTRIVQTASWKVQIITDIHVNDNILYAVLDHSTIVACDMSTGEKLWIRFETAKINRGIAIHAGELAYSCHGLVKLTNGKDVTTIRVPLVNACSIEHQDDQNIYVTSNEGANICCIHTPSMKLKWEVLGTKQILESVTAKSSDGSDLLITRTASYIAVVNLTLGKVEASIQTPHMARLRKTGKHILIQKTTGSTTVIPGVENETDR